MRHHSIHAAGTAITALVALLGTPAQAQEEIQTEKIVALDEWAYSELYADGWAADMLTEEAVVISAEAGEEIGDVENILISPDGQILSIVAEVGGLWDIGDTHVSIPWDEVELAEGLGAVVVPVTEETVEAYSIYGEKGVYDYAYDEPIVSDEEEEIVTAEQVADEITVVDEDVESGPRIWRASELIDDYALLQDGAAYGYVDDLIFSEAGELKAVVIDPAAAGDGPYAYPWYGYEYGWDPGRDYYELPYGEDEVVNLDPFEYERLGRRAELEDEIIGDEAAGD